MLNISSLACAKFELWDLTVCIVVNGEKVQCLAVTLTMISTMPNSELVLDTFIYYNVFTFHVPGLIPFDEHHDIK